MVRLRLGVSPCLAASPEVFTSNSTLTAVGCQGTLTPALSRREREVGCSFVDGGEEAFAVDAVDEGYERQCAGDFVALEVADEVPVDAGSGRELPVADSDVAGFVPEFLGAAFAEVVAAGGDEFGGFAGVDVFGYADERDFIRGAAGGFGGSGDALADAV